MKIFRSIKMKTGETAARSSSTRLLIVLSFILWMVLMRGFLFGNLSLIGDAVPYYTHARFFIENLAQGVYPLWDPTSMADSGVPNEFYLRRMGEFNPFYAIVLILFKGGMSFDRAYLIFLAIYYWLGCLGFYFLVKALTKNKAAALLGYLLLFFSSLGTNLFDNFIHLLFVPMTWFFYFLVDWAQAPKRSSLMGLILSLMIILTTYIPFYFVTIFLVFLIAYVLFFARQIKPFFIRSGRFMGQHKLLVIFCLIAFSCSLVPGYLFYKAGASQETVLPRRHYDSGVHNTVEVDIRKVSRMGLLAHIDFDRLVANLKRFRLAVFYLPLLAYLLLVLGAFNRLNKRHYLYAVWGLVIFFIASPDISSLHHLLYKHLFFFRYFRNLHFFFWIFLLPLFVLFLSEQFHAWAVSRVDRADGSPRAAFVPVVVSHAGLLVWLAVQPGGLVSSYCVLALSFVCFSLWASGRVRVKGAVTLWLMFALVVIQPIEVYSYFNKNSLPYVSNYKASRVSAPFSFTRYVWKKTSVDKDKIKSESASGEVIKKPTRRLYYSCRWYSFAYQNIDFDAFDKYRNNKFYLYDNVSPLDEAKMNLNVVNKVLGAGLNAAFIASEDPRYLRPKRVHGYSPLAEKLEDETAAFKIVDRDVNTITLQMKNPQEKFLVYNDAYHDGWRVFIDGKRIDLLRANIAFKGVWVPPGEHLVRFQFQDHSAYVFKWTILLAFYLSFLILAGLLFFERKAARS